GGPPPSAGTLPRPGQRKAKSAVYRIESDGRIEQMFALPDGYLTALAVADDGAVLAASGTQGHVYRITADRTASLVVDVPERQSLTLLRADAEVWVGTGDSAGLYRAHAPADNAAHYLSKVFDAESPARWGTLRWQGADVTFETRSGNTAKPDAGWSAWQPTASKATDANGAAGAVVSPPARYLQYQARLASRKGRLRGVTAYYLPQNQRARITELTLADAAAVPATGAATTARPAKSPVLKLRWKVDNTDGDELIYRLHFRLQSEATWRPLAGVAGDPLTKPEYDWNTEGVPDGLYIVHVTASDERAQPAERALSSGFDSAPLLVDNRRPIVRDLKGKYPTVEGRAVDDASPITQLEYSVDGGDWMPLSPADGIADEPTEAFAIRLPKLVRGPHTVVVRATDSADNVGAADLVIEAP
ncbi:MAG TPA: hypothetical protein VHU40_09180, partial [Polyangia bacterium]|nr:hypothetical protein [Polyangia bacterium]